MKGNGYISMKGPLDPVAQAFELAFGRSGRQQSGRAERKDASSESDRSCLTNFTDELAQIMSEAEFDLLEGGGGDGGEGLLLPKFHREKARFFWPDGSVAGIFSAWPKATLKNQRVTCKLHDSCVKTVSTSKVPAKDAWEQWLLRGRRPDVDTAAKHKAEWTKMVAEYNAAA